MSKPGHLACPGLVYLKKVRKWHQGRRKQKNKQCPSFAQKSWVSVFTAAHNTHSELQGTTIPYYFFTHFPAVAIINKPLPLLGASGCDRECDICINYV